MARQVRSHFELRLAMNARTNPKKLFAHFQSSKRLQNRIAVLQNSSGNEITDSQTEAYLFSNVFVLSYRSDDGAEPPPFFRDAVQIMSNLRWPH